MENNQCGSCKYFAQGKYCSYCEHPEANKEEKKYRHYSFGCADNFEQGTSQTRIDWYNNLPKEDKDKFKEMKDWPNQELFKELIKNL